ncbi:hypothetical protein RFI_35223, partial [Reticulomyxa filosa]
MDLGLASRLDLKVNLFSGDTAVVSTPKLYLSSVVTIGLYTYGDKVTLSGLILDADLAHNGSFIIDGGTIISTDLELAGVSHLEFRNSVWIDSSLLIDSMLEHANVIFDNVKGQKTTKETLDDCSADYFDITLLMSNSANFINVYLRVSDGVSITQGESDTPIYKVTLECDSLCGCNNGVYLYDLYVQSLSILCHDDNTCMGNIWNVILSSDSAANVLITATGQNTLQYTALTYVIFVTPEVNILLHCNDGACYDFDMKKIDNAVGSEYDINVPYQRYRLNVTCANIRTFSTHTCGRTTITCPDTPTQHNQLPCTFDMTALQYSSNDTIDGNNDGLIIRAYSGPPIVNIICDDAHRNGSCQYTKVYCDYPQGVKTCTMEYNNQTREWSCVGLCNNFKMQTNYTLIVSATPDWPSRFQSTTVNCTLYADGTDVRSWEESPSVYLQCSGYKSCQHMTIHHDNKQSSQNLIILVPQDASNLNSDSFQYSIDNTFYFDVPGGNGQSLTFACEGFASCLRDRVFLALGKNAASGTYRKTSTFAFSCRQNAGACYEMEVDALTENADADIDAVGNVTLNLTCDMWRWQKPIRMRIDEGE